jgi:hypothetical protein
MTLIQEKGKPSALLSPGTIRVTMETFSLLPQLQGLRKKYPKHRGHIKSSVPRQEFVDNDQVKLSTPITAIVFPLIGKTQNHELRSIARSIGLARLIESSLDQWDQDVWSQHIDFLERLSHSVEFYELFLGQNMVTLPQHLERHLVA